MQANYPECYKAVRVFEGGNDDDPQDPGGRTSRGITQREWDIYRKTHPGRPADVWQASEDDIAAIYGDDYWAVQSCGSLSSGIDETIFDYGVNSGVGRAPKVLRRCLHMPDNAPAAEVLERISSLPREDRRILIHAVNDERLAFLQSLRTWGRFGKGWGRRVMQVKNISLRLHDNPVGTVVTKQLDPVPTPKGQHPEPKVAKNITKGSGGLVAGASAVGWAQSHPVETVLIVIAVAAVVGAVIYLIDKNHKRKQEAPPKGWKPPVWLKPKTRTADVSL